MKRSRKSNVNEGGQDDEAADGAESANPEASAAGGSSSLPRLAPAPSQEEMTSSFRIQTGSNGSANEKENKDSEVSDRGSHNPEPSTRDRAEDAAPEKSTTPMDMDTKETKEES